MNPDIIKWLVNASYFVVAVLFILGLKAMSSPVSAKKGIVWAGIAMVAASLVTFLYPGLHNFALMILAIAIGGAVAWWSGKVVKMTDMPQMVAIYNGMGGGAAAAIAAHRICPRPTCTACRHDAGRSRRTDRLGGLHRILRRLRQAAGHAEEDAPPAGAERRSTSCWRSPF